MKITIIDYGVGNIASLRNAFSALNIPVEVTLQKAAIQQAEKLILPGVGAFAPAIQRLKEKQFDKLIIEKANQGTPILGICLGMQLLFSTSYEQGEWPGLNLIPGTVHRFEKIKKIPHMGWNQIKKTPRASLFEHTSAANYFYFVHSYFCKPDNEDHTAATCEYGNAFCAAVQFNNICGVQFHPEKSQNDGLQVLRNFAERTVQ